MNSSVSPSGSSLVGGSIGSAVGDHVSINQAVVNDVQIEQQLLNASSHLPAYEDVVLPFSDEAEFGDNSLFKTREGGSMVEH